MTRSRFLAIAALVGAAVGALCLVWPAGLLASKGLGPDPVAAIWVRQVGVLLIATAVTGFLVRRHPGSPTLRVLLLGLAAAQVGLLAVEVVACAVGVLPSWGAIAGNSVAHVLLATGFTWFALTARSPDVPRDADDAPPATVAAVPGSGHEPLAADHQP